MKWNHLPVAGGIYDQHPRLLEEWRIIFSEKNKYERKEMAERERKAKTRKR